jgi:hypothetical protein
MFAATDSTIVVAWISLIGGLVGSATAVFIALIKMKRSNTDDHNVVVESLARVVGELGEVRSDVKVVVAGQEGVVKRVDEIRDVTSSTSKALIRHLEEHTKD